MTCSVEGCDGTVAARGWCWKHYARWTRNGHLGVQSHFYSFYSSPEGYQVVRVPDHPLANSKGYAYVHRVVLYGLIGGGTHLCAWCGKELTWMAERRGDWLTVDHLDHDPTNNDEANLVPSCQPCNAKRRRRLAVA